GSVNGNSTADILVRFRSVGAPVLFAWGGHLAQSRYWDTAAGGARDGASLVSGAPWHMRTLKLDGAGNKNQDRSIQPSAIVGELPPQALSPVPPAPRPTSRPPTAPRDPSAPGVPGGPRATVPPTSTTVIREVTGTPVPAILYLAGLAGAVLTLSLRHGWRRRSRAPD
ncbi:MAG TPA: hypothetical protein VFR46_09745, partial [Actinomycetes bacterium]|nr:hypothetical protein [Actinomycetes bacterium]